MGSTRDPFSKKQTFGTFFIAYIYIYIYIYIYMCVCVCVYVCVRACVRVCVCVWLTRTNNVQKYEMSGRNLNGIFLNDFWGLKV